MPDMKASRKVRAIIIGAVVVGLVGALLWSKRWAEPMMEVTITVSAEGEEPVEAYRNRASVVGAAGHERVLESEVDLGQWEGQLVRLDVSGEVRASGLLPLHRGHIGFSAELVGPDGAKPLEFLGWENNGSLPIHFGRIGCPTFVASGGVNPPLVFSKSGSLWHVLRVPAGAALRVALKPVLTEEAEKAKPFVGVERSQAFQGSESEGTEMERRPDVFIYLVDTLRADHLGCYGYSRETSPEIDRFAGEATLYEQAQTAATWTRPSVAALLTGLYASANGALDPARIKLAEWPVFLPEILKGQGYATYGVLTNITVSEKFGFNQGYHRFEHRPRERASWVNERVAEDLAQQPPEQPVFVYAHIMEPHLPYTPEPESLKLFDRGIEARVDGSRKALGPTRRIRACVSAEDVEHLIDLYDAEIYDSDRGFAEFLKVLRRAGRFDNALIVFVADHGEAFNEHGTVEHGKTLNQEEMHVPLIIRYPNGRFRGVRMSPRVSLIDVLPTILGVVGIEPELDYPLVGRSLVPGALSSDEASVRCIHCEVSRHVYFRLDLVGIIDEDGYKRVLDASGRRSIKGRTATEESVGLWNTEEDVGEQVDLRSSNPVRAAYDEQLIAQWLQEQRHWCHVLAREPALAVELTDEMRKELQALGYLD